jgi:hypothetical protein
MEGLVYLIEDPNPNNGDGGAGAVNSQTAFISSNFTFYSIDFVLKLNI